MFFEQPRVTTLTRGLFDAVFDFTDFVFMILYQPHNLIIAGNEAIAFYIRQTCGEEIASSFLLAMTGRLLLKQTTYKRLAVKQLQIVNTLAYANVFYGYLKLV